MARPRNLAGNNSEQTIHGNGPMATAMNQPARALGHGKQQCAEKQNAVAAKPVAEETGGHHARHAAVNRRHSGQPDPKGIPLWMQSEMRL